MALTLAAFPVVVIAAGWIEADRRERAEDRSAFRTLDACVADMLGFDRDARLPHGGRQAGIGGHSRGAGEVLAGSLGDENRGGPDGGPGHGRQDRVKKVSLHHGFQVLGDVDPLGRQGGFPRLGWSVASIFPLGY